MVSQDDIYNIIKDKGGRTSRKVINTELKKLDPAGKIHSSLVTKKISSLVNWQLIRREKFLGGYGKTKSDMEYSIIREQIVTPSVETN